MSNQTTGALESRRDHWRRYEALPPRLREVMARAPWNLHVGSWSKGLPAAPEAARRALIARIVEKIGRLALDTYGSDHPQAAPSPTPLAPEWERGPYRTGRRG